MRATVGRIVHYTNLGDRDGKYPPATVPAIVTGVNDDGTLALTCFYRTGLFNLEKVEQSEAPAGFESSRGKWAWPALTD